MINRGPDERQTKRNINCFTKGQTFYGNHRLIVITGNNRIEFTPRRSKKNSVGGIGTMNIDVVHLAARFDRRHYLGSLFDAEKTAFGTMRIQGCDCESRSLDSPTLQLTMGEIDYLNEPISFNHPDCLGKRDVSRQEYYS